MKSTVLYVVHIVSGEYGLSYSHKIIKYVYRYRHINPEMIVRRL
nr:MAG TPA: hypothetical protein [Caudoviricetes sp.]